MWHRHARSLSKDVMVRCVDGGETTVTATRRGGVEGGNLGVFVDSGAFVGRQRDFISTPR
jgi:hypothetical protein